MSMTGDMSKGTPKDFKEQEKVTEKVMKRPDSPLSSVSVRSDASRFSGTDSGVSSVSMKSDASIGKRPNFTGEGSRVSAGRVLCDVCPIPAVKTCLTCRDSYCGTCIRPHYSNPDLERHQLQDLQDQSLCQQHHKQLEFYCRTDQSAICSRCFLKDHKEHDVVEQDANETQCQVTKTGGIPPPGQIQFLSVQPDSVTLRWSPPEGAPGLHRYMVTRRRGHEQHSIPVKGFQMEVTGLLPGEKYHFTVVTLSEDGRHSPGVWGSVHTEVPMPENLTVESNSSCVSLKWTKQERIDPVSYLLELFCEGQGEQPRIIHTDLLRYSISDFQHGNKYTVHVFTLKNGRQSKPTFKSFTAEIPVPERLTVSSITASSAGLSWLVSPEMEQTPHSFLVSYQSDGTEPKTICTGSCSTDITDLKPGTEYTVRVYTVLQHGGKSQPASDKIKTVISQCVSFASSIAKPFAVSQSCGSFSDYEIKKERAQRTCSSQSFLKPTMTLLKVIKGLQTLRSLSKKHSSLQVTDGSSLYVSKLDPGHASQLHAALQLAKPSLLTRDRDAEDGGMERKGLKQEDETVTVQPSQARSTTGKVLNPEWRSMTKSAVKITLDPKTANPTLRISADGRRVRSITFEESKEKQHAWFQRAPHKYDGWFCIQGTEGFSSGRHYWEVDVGGCSDWRIGVVKESAPRHGFTKLTTSSGYWTLRLQLGRLIALTDPVTKLNQPIPRRVGVYLDMEGRQVRFFDAKQRRHMYTFQGDFGNSEKIYPVLGTVDTNREVVIL